MHMVTAEPGEPTAAQMVFVIQILAIFPLRIYRREVKSTLSHLLLLLLLLLNTLDCFGWSGGTSLGVPCAFRPSHANWGVRPARAAAGVGGPGKAIFWDASFTPEAFGGMGRLEPFLASSTQQEGRHREGAGSLVIFE